MQPLVLLPLPFVLMLIRPRRLIGFLAQAAAPSAALLGIAAAANWSATFRAVTSQPILSSSVGHNLPVSSMTTQRQPLLSSTR